MRICTRNNTAWTGTAREASAASIRSLKANCGAAASGTAPGAFDLKSQVEHRPYRASSSAKNSLISFHKSTPPVNPRQRERTNPTSL